MSALIASGLDLSITSLIEKDTVPAVISLSSKKVGFLMIAPKIPVIKMFLLAKLQGQYDMDNQEYLDRQDEYKMTFFLDENMKWIDSQIIINEWIVRFDDMNL